MRTTLLLSVLSLLACGSSSNPSADAGAPGADAGGPSLPQVNLPASGIYTFTGDVRDERLTRIDPTTGAVSAELPQIEGNAEALALSPKTLHACERALWVGSFAHDALQRIDPVKLRVTKQIMPGDAVDALACGAGSIWAGSLTGGFVKRYDDKLAELASLEITAPPLTTMAFAGPYLWVLVLGAGGNLIRVDPKSNTKLPPLDLGQLQDGYTPLGAAGSTDKLFVAAVNGQNKIAILTVDGTSGTLLSASTFGSGPSDPKILLGARISVAFGFGSIWLPIAPENRVLRVDPATAKVLASVDVAGRPQDVTTGFGKVWITTGPDQGLVDIDEPGAVGRVLGVDPATNAIAIKSPELRSPTKITVLE